MSFLIVGLCPSCEEFVKKPLDARTRDVIDSAANAQSRLAREAVDSFYKINHDRLLHYYMDSLMTVRRREIEEQIRSVKK